MANHWTYRTLGKAEDDLVQGDILEPTVQLREVFAEVHPHFCQEKYLGFMVLSQSCDLVRRPACKARHINLCVIREFSAVLPEMLRALCGSGMSAIFREEKRESARMFLDRVINQNEQAMGLFYLYPDADAGVSVDALAILRVAVALRAEHYPHLIAARRGGLSVEFQAKLGWLVGNLYSRIGTTDWGDHVSDQEQKRMVTSFLDGVSPATWVRGEIIDAAKSQKIDLGLLSPDELKDALAKLEPTSAMDLLLQGTTDVLKKMFPNISDEEVERFRRRLQSNNLFTQGIRRAKKG